MKRIVMTAVATLSLAAPSAALAHHHGERHHHHRGRHHGQAHVLAFHAQRPATSTAPTSGTPSTSPAPSSEESAGTIASFENNVLTIKLNDGSTVSGKVTEQTEIECSVPTGSSAPGTSSFGEREHGDDGHFGDRGPGGDDPWDQSDQGDGGDHHGDCPGHQAGQQTEHCTTAALTQGASVKEALLSVSSQGATWLKVEL
ncbi:MAG TPA: hypothetical protein VMB05_03375 [Solirubrobacteraceae bacterium]|nr:hypothetical protein [Solirubrobacteraceae bacterium]